MRQERALVWFRNDLRLLDHEPLTEAIAKFKTVIPVYIFDSHLFDPSLSHPKLGNYRAQFLIQSVQVLQEALRQLGSDLIVRIGQAAVILPQLAAEWQIKHVYFSEEAAPYEREQEKKLEEAFIRKGISFDSFWQATLCSKKDLPFSIPHLPDVFTKFRVQVERNWNSITPRPAPTQLPPLPEIVQKAVLQNTFPQTPSSIPDQRAAFSGAGGEKAALAHLEKYIWQNEFLATYEETRNGLIGEKYSSKLSAWLALGCISPRFVYAEVKRFEQERIKNKSTYWLIFELLWRDYFRFATLKFGARFFQAGGIKNNPPPTNPNQELIHAWQSGQTGFPFIDANMRELALTGFMSNRGRQNVASFFVHTLQQDWRLGAAWFESQLIDYDPCSNWGNWCYVAGVGNDPRKDRLFNTAAQSERYDTHAEFIKLWCPELNSIPHRYLHRFFEYSETTIRNLGVVLGKDYPKPICTYIHTPL
jgi:deoxyribodipyrimidine photo-lyase